MKIDINKFRILGLVFMMAIMLGTIAIVPKQAQAANDSAAAYQGGGAGPTIYKKIRDGSGNIICQMQSSMYRDNRNGKVKYTVVVKPLWDDYCADSTYIRLRWGTRGNIRSKTTYAGYRAVLSTPWLADGTHVGASTNASADGYSVWFSH